MKIILTLLALLAFAASGRSAVLEWDANSETNLAGYRVYMGPSSRNYTTNFTTTNTIFTVTNVVVSKGTNYFAVTAFDTDGLESDYSDEVNGVFTNRPAVVTGVKFAARLAVQSAPAVTGPWTQEMELAMLDATPSTRFYRLGIALPESAAIKRFITPVAPKQGKLVSPAQRPPFVPLPIP